MLIWNAIIYAHPFDNTGDSNLNMRHVLYGIRVILQLAGIMLVVTSWLVRNRGAMVANALFGVGALLFFAGLLIHRTTRLKRCPRCAEKVKIEAPSCSLCGFNFPATTLESILRPFYK
jgi:hypothetical protein